MDEGLLETRPVTIVLYVTPLPTPFQIRMRALLGSEADAFFASLTGPPHVGLRVNTLRCSPEAFAELSPWPLEPLPWCESGFLLGAPGARPGLHPLHRAGVYYLQEPSAMAVAEAVAPKPGERVIDLAAAPGGKATHLTSLMNNQGLLVANEVTGSRVRALGENLERYGARNTLITQESVAKLAERWGAAFDRVLLDAPCSGEGMFRKSDEALAQWSEYLVQSCAARQHDLLGEAAGLVKPGGILVYSTCTFAPEENETVVAEFLRENPEFGLEPLLLPDAQPGRPDWLTTPNPELVKTARFWPHLSPGEGHFIAKLRRQDGAEAKVKPAVFAPLARQAKGLWEAFMTETFAQNPVPDAPLTLQGDNLYALPATSPDLAGLRTLRPGLWLGTLKKKRFEPSHSLALALTPPALGGTRTLELAPDAPDLTRYLRGDVLDVPDIPGPDGWLVVTTRGFALGWGRRVRGTIKNFYPKGLRLP